MAVYNGSEGEKPNWAGSDRGQTLPVGSFDPNPNGLYDVHGNVWEWVDDCWNETLAAQPRDGSSRRDGDCSRAVFRGGSWGNDPFKLRSAYRNGDLRDYRSYFVGFRLARTKVE